MSWWSRTEGRPGPDGFLAEGGRLNPQTSAPVTDDAVLLLNELVANAGQWTGCKHIGIRLRMTRSRLRIDVEDGSCSLPVRCLQATTTRTAAA